MDELQGGGGHRDGGGDGDHGGGGHSISCVQQLGGAAGGAGKEADTENLQPSLIMSCISEIMSTHQTPHVVGGFVPSSAETV